MTFCRCWPILLVALVAHETAHAQDQPPVYGYEIVNQYPHDTSAFTQGLVLLGDRLFESTGLYGSSTLREVDLASGAVIRKVDVPPAFFAEGMTIFQGKIFQLTWQSRVGFIYALDTFEQIGQFSYTGEGWGLTHDGRYLIMSDGTNRIRFIDPATFAVVRSIDVFNQGSPLTRINELEYINGQIYGNVWQTNWIVRIDPVSGAITGWIDLTGLLPPGVSADVLNGIAYEPNSGNLLVTGKFWPSLFEIRLIGNAAPVAEHQSVSTAEDTSLDVVLTASDSDGDALTFTVVSGPGNGTLSGSLPRVTYAPAANYAGADSFTFRASDGVTASTATVSILVSPVNDLPVASADGYDVQANTTLVVASPGILSNDVDVDGDSLTAVLVAPPSHGSLSLNANGSFTYTPSPGFAGTDNFSYRARDAAAVSETATVTLTVAGAAPSLQLSASSLSFGNQAIGTTSAARTVTLTNPGLVPQTISSILITGAQAGDFAQSNGCGTSLGPGGRCTVHVTFTPTATGQRRASMSITTNAEGSPHLVALSGAGKKNGR